MASAEIEATPEEIQASREEIVSWLQLVRSPQWQATMGRWAKWKLAEMTEILADDKVKGKGLAAARAELRVWAWIDQLEATWMGHEKDLLDDDLRASREKEDVGSKADEQWHQAAKGT